MKEWILICAVYLWAALTPAPHPEMSSEFYFSLIKFVRRMSSNCIKEETFDQARNCSNLVRGTRTETLDNLLFPIFQSSNSSSIVQAHNGKWYFELFITDRYLLTKRSSENRRGIPNHMIEGVRIKGLLLINPLLHSSCSFRVSWTGVEIYLLCTVYDGVSGSWSSSSLHAWNDF